MSTYLLTDNLYNTRQYPSHTVTASGGAVTGYEVFRIANARRHARDYWTPSSSNTTVNIDVACDRVRAANMLVIDRNSGLSGATVTVTSSQQSSYATSEDISFTVPASVYRANTLRPGHPVKTQEGAIILTFNLSAGKYWRVTVAAMGAGIKPTIGGLWLGRSYTPTIVPLPWDDETRYLERQDVRLGMPGAFSDTGRSADLRIMVKNDAEWETARRSMLQFWSGTPLWYVADSDYGENSWLGYAPPTSFGAPYTNRTGRDLTISLSELQPVRV